MPARAQEYDTDGNGQISFPEFLAMMWRLQSGPSEKEIVTQMFAVRRAEALAGALVRAQAPCYEETLRQGGCGRFGGAGS